MSESPNTVLVAELARLSSDPLAWVQFAFPWGEPDGELADKTGPEAWQAEVLTAIRDGLVDLREAVQIAVTSGHGVGKSALVAWLVLWAMSTFEDTKGVITANTENQLKTKTWAEVAKWYRMFIGKELFRLTATALFSVDPAHEKTWRIDMVPWSERNTEAFAGLHNAGKRILVVFDEASAIPDLIWEVTEGALTDRDTQILWAVFGNPTQARGRFRECFPGGRFSHRWTTLEVDSRTVSFTNREQHERWIEDYGLDSDFVRVRILGKFPRIDATSFISLSVAEEAVRRAVVPQRDIPLVLGVDVGRFGDDPSVIYPRQGLDAKSREPEVLFGLDTMELAVRVAEAAARYGASFVFVDEGGVGGGVVDRLRQLGAPVIGVQFGGKPVPGPEEEAGVRYLNRRASMWGAMRAWLKRGAIVNRVQGVERSLPEELSGPAYTFTAQDKIQLESKKDMRRRGVPSPNVADALALTFAMPVIGMLEGGALRTGQCPAYNPLEKERLFA